MNIDSITDQSRPCQMVDHDVEKFKLCKKFYITFKRFFKYRCLKTFFVILHKEWNPGHGAESERLDRNS